MQKYESNISKRKIIVLSTSGLLFTLVVIFGASHFIPGKMHRYWAVICAPDVRNIPKRSILIPIALGTDVANDVASKNRRFLKDLDHLFLKFLCAQHCAAS